MRGQKREDGGNGWAKTGGQGGWWKQFDVRKKVRGEGKRPEEEGGRRWMEGRVRREGGESGQERESGGERRNRR